jgi:endonuclease/exonuclease/phosphatase family metal-dependent hydrolase
MPSKIKKVYRLVFGVIGLGVLSFLAFLAFSLRPGVSPQTLAPSAVLHFPQYAASTPNEKSRRVKVVTYNIGYASGIKNNQGAVLLPEEIQKNLDEIASVLETLDADIVLLQEVDFFSARSFKTNQLTYLADKLKMPYAAYAVTWNKRYVAWPYWPPKRHFGRTVSGQGVLSRHPILEQKITVLPKPEDNPFWYNWFYLDRVIQSLSIQVGETACSVYHLHLEAFSAETRKQQWQRLIEAVTQDDNPVKIAAGDFNEPWRAVGLPEAELNASQQLLTNFASAAPMKMAQKEPGQYTFPSSNPQEDIDHIFYSDSLELKDEGVVTGILASDHLPFWALLEK